MDEHVRDRYLEWRDGSPDRREKIGRHLRDCQACRRYFSEMDRFLDPALLGAGPELTPDPHLPGRIAALSAMRSRAEAEDRPGGLLIVLQGAAFAAAVVIGIVIGSIAYDAPSPADVEEIVSLCRDAVQPDDDAVRFEAVLDDSEGGLP